MLQRSWIIHGNHWAFVLLIKLRSLLHLNRRKQEKDILLVLLSLLLLRPCSTVYRKPCSVRNQARPKASWPCISESHLLEDARWVQFAFEIYAQMQKCSEFVKVGIEFKIQAYFLTSQWVRNAPFIRFLVSQLNILTFRFDEISLIIATWKCSEIHRVRAYLFPSVSNAFN